MTVAVANGPDGVPLVETFTFSLLRAPVAHWQAFYATVVGWFGAGKEPTANFQQLSSKRITMRRT
jgi:hypothetical protein